MLEVLILLNILIVLIVYNTKTIIANSSKYDLYEIKEDIFYLNDSEYDLLKEVEDLIKNDEEVFAFISSYKDDLNINYEHIFSENENFKLQRKIEEIRLIDRAKCILIQYLQMTEPQAHKYIEKQAMNLRQSRVQMAESILKTYER